MIIPSIDLKDGKAVQMAYGQDEPVDVRDPYTLADSLSVVGTCCLIDLDRALGTGKSNLDVIRRIVREHPHAMWRVGGGLRERHEVWDVLLSLGSNVQAIIGTSATPDFLKQFPRERVVAAVDHRGGTVTSHGWTQDTRVFMRDKILEIAPYVQALHITRVVASGTLTGLESWVGIPEVQASVALAGGASTVEEIRKTDKNDMDVIVGMALRRGSFTLGEAVAGLLRIEPHGLIPTVIYTDQGSLGLAWSSRETLIEAIDTRKVVLHSRKRGRWVKGDTSGNVPRLLQVNLDCDRDAVRMLVEMRGKPWCHRGDATCWDH